MQSTKLISKETGYIIVNSKSGVIIQSSFEYLRRDCISRFVQNTGNDWSYWRTKYNWRCQKVKQVMYEI